jgi:hypothetical protein
MGALEILQRRKLSVSDFHRMGEAGILHEDDRIELIDGELIEKAPIESLHASKVNLLSRTLHFAVGDDAIISVRNPIALPPRDEPGWMHARFACRKLILPALSPTSCCLWRAQLWRT